jgi:hypothetical protein
VADMNFCPLWFNDPASDSDYTELDRRTISE